MIQPSSYFFILTILCSIKKQLNILYKLINIRLKNDFEKFATKKFEDTIVKFRNHT